MWHIYFLSKEMQLFSRIVPISIFLFIYQSFYLLFLSTNSLVGLLSQIMDLLGCTCGYARSRSRVEEAIFPKLAMWGVIALTDLSQSDYWTRASCFYLIAIFLVSYEGDHLFCGNLFCSAICQFFFNQLHFLLINMQEP